MNKLFLGVNIDHIATLRNARGTKYPDPIQAAFIVEQAGADGITIHLREDRRHITDRDLEYLNKTITTKINLEMAVTNEMINIACRIKPTFCCLVPEKREEVTTEGGLSVTKQKEAITYALKQLNKAGILVSLFIDPDHEQVDAAEEVGVSFIEIHTGSFANAKTLQEQDIEFYRIRDIISYASNKGIKVNAGHGLNYHNVYRIAQLPEIYELNIGHAIISRALFSGLMQAIYDMKKILIEARK
ncbi:Pyridoxine 5'-phosphate synthase [Candidatus Providencia siddallii]|uniref:Pyridoxine 5'-phosphate synthase n=1 Tax=Candidatus Providencia siddallii TaxID=1715285 RepID=A0A0M6W7A1_9GAMM|nr:Pyridoxine 5'-phosphate synthase [Candidatus Providencia siddallii]